MKTKTLVFVLLLFAVATPLSSQTYSVSDSLALLAIDASCDASDSLNWDTEPDPGNWKGVTWNSDNPKRVSALELNSKSLTDTLDVSGLTSVESLECSYNQLIGLDLSGLTAITYMTCYLNLLTDLDVSTLVNLTTLSCRDNQLTSLDVSTLIHLEYFRCNRNQLTELDVSNLTGMIHLDCSGNQLTALDVSAMSTLTELECSSNQITSLDLASLDELSILVCHENQLTTLDVSTLTKLTELYCYNNRITELDVLALLDLATLQCYGNRLPFSSLATGLHVGDFIYSPQDTLFEPETISGNTTIDYSPEAIIDGTATHFIFYKDGTEAETNSTGLFTTTGSGEYYCTMTNDKFPGLTLTTSPVTITEGSGYRPEQTAGFSFYPNPVKDKINFSSPERIKGISVFTLSGFELIKTSNSIDGIDVSWLSEGIYILCVMVDDTLCVYKIVIEY